LGIRLSECGGAVLMDNVVRLDGGPGLQIDQSDRLRATGNRVEGDGTHVKGSAGCDLRGNDLGRSALLDGCADATVNENRTTDDGSIVLAAARGDWQVNDNRAGGDIRLTPAQQFRPGGIVVNPGLIGTLPSFAARTSPMIRAIEILAGAEAGGDIEPAAALAANPTPADARNFLAATPDVSGGLREAVTVDIGRVIDDVLVGSLVPIGRLPITVFRGEVQIRAQLVGNRCANLFVGNPETTETNSQSVIHVVANSVSDALGIGQYARRNVSQNIARSYVGPVQPNPANFGADNLDLP
jgi:hypothetical protein